MKRGRPQKIFEEKRVQVTVKIRHVNWVAEYGCKDVSDLIDKLVARANEIQRELQNLRNSQSVLDAKTTINQQQNP